MREKRDAYKLLVRMSEGNRPLGRPWHRWEENIKMVLREIGWGDMDWIDLAQGCESMVISTADCASNFLL
jgi:hypothetical protein